MNVIVLSGPLYLSPEPSRFSLVPRRRLESPALLPFASAGAAGRSVGGRRVCAPYSCGVMPYSCGAMPYSCGAMPSAVWRSPDRSSGGSMPWLDVEAALSGKNAGHGFPSLPPQQDSLLNKLPSDLATPCIFFPSLARRHGGGDAVRRRQGGGFLRSVLPPFLLLVLCISGIFNVFGFVRCWGGMVATVPSDGRAWSCGGAAPGGVMRRIPGSVMTDFSPCCFSVVLQRAVCVYGGYAIAVVCFGWISTKADLVEGSSDEHRKFAASVLCILEHVAVGDEHYSSWCFSCFLELRLVDKLAEDDSHPSELIHRWQMRAPLSMILRFDGRDPYNLGSVMLLTDLQPDCPEPQVLLPARLLGEPPALRLARTQEVPEDCCCGCAPDFSPGPPSGSDGRLLRHLHVCFISWFHVLQYGTNFVIPFVGV